MVEDDSLTTSKRNMAEGTALLYDEVVKSLGAWAVEENDAQKRS